MLELLRSAATRVLHAGMSSDVGLPPNLLATLSDPEKRRLAYDALAASGTVAPRTTPEAVSAALASHTIFDAYLDPDAVVTRAAAGALA